MRSRQHLRRNPKSDGIHIGGLIQLSNQRPPESCSSDRNDRSGSRNPQISQSLSWPPTRCVLGMQRADAMAELVPTKTVKSTRSCTCANRERSTVRSVRKHITTLESTTYETRHKQKQTFVATKSTGVSRKHHFLAFLVRWAFL